jgi:hypothetical protein
MGSMVFTCAVAAAFCVAPPAAAAAPTTPDAAGVAAADRLLEAMHYDSLLDRTLDAIVAEAQRSIGEQLNKGLDKPLPPDLVAKLQGIAASHMRNAVTEHRADLKRGTALIYARHFTTDELAKLAAIQSEPVMVKMQAETPQIAAETMALSRGVIESAREGVEEEVKAAVLDYLNQNDTKPSS